MAALLATLAVVCVGMVLSPTQALAAAVPGAPQALAAVPGNGTLTVSWSAPVDDGGSPVTAYRLCFSQWQDACYREVDGSARSTVFTGISGGSRMDVWVYAVNSVGRGEPATAGALVLAAPGAPVGLTVDQRPGGVARLSWTPAYPNGQTPLAYTLSVDGGAVVRQLAVRAWDSAPPDPQGAKYYWIDVPGLDDGLPHVASVTATNDGGTGPAAELEFELGPSDDLLPGESLAAGQRITSDDGRYSLTVQADGNLVVYAADGRPIWHSATWSAAGERLVLQADGNLVLTGLNRSLLWHSDTWGRQVSHLQVTDTGRVVLVDTAGSVLWATAADRGQRIVFDTLSSAEQLTSNQRLVSTNGAFQFVVQPDGNAVVYGPARQVLWHSWSWGQPGNRLVLQGDGNAVLYRADRRVAWHPGTWGNDGARMVMQDDGNLVIYASSGRALWSSRYGRA